MKKMKNQSRNSQYSVSYTNYSTDSTLCQVYNPDLIDAPIVDLLDGVAVIHRNWGIIDYRNCKEPGKFFTDVHGLKSLKAWPCSLEFKIGDSKVENSKIQLFHEVLFEGG